jgi:hypothetical protein
MYQEWAFQLFPGLARDDLIDGVAKMGSKPLVRSHLMRMRDRERDRYMVSGVSFLEAILMCTMVLSTFHFARIQYA